MAKKSKIAKNNQRAEKVLFYADARRELTSIIKDPEATYEDKREAQKKIAKMPRDASATRYRNRCEITGSPHGVYGKLRISRIALRELASKGRIPGMTKSSW